MILEKGGKLSRTRSRGFPFIAIICLQITEDDTENTKEKENHAGHGDSKPHSKHNLFNKSFGTMMPIITTLSRLRPMLKPTKRVKKGNTTNPNFSRQYQIIGETLINR